MKASMEICVIPIGAGVSVSDHVAICQRIFRKAGLTPELHAFGTNVEGEIEVLMDVVRQCHEALHENGVARIQTSLKLATRTDREQSLSDKVESVQQKLETD